MEGKIFQLTAEREAIVREVIDRMLAQRAAPGAVELGINDTAYSEILRLEGDREASGELHRFQALYRSLGRLGPEEQRRVLAGLVEEYVRDIVGNFDPRAYRFATAVLPPALSLLLRGRRFTRAWAQLGDLTDRIHLQGNTAMLQALARRGTVIMVPTHSSNLDSLVVGYGIYHLGLPPFTYGAGKNLFTNPVLSYFMRNLGAYRVDRRLTHGLYKDVLKTYSQVILELGYHSLFFPAGGRVRSGALERKLKLGLLGTGLAAYTRNLQQGRPNPNLYVVPCTLNYHLVLEAETLIDDHLKSVGKSRYIIEDDESSRLTRVASFVWRSMRMDYGVTLRFGDPLDLFGNRVDAEGRSLDQHGRLVDPASYLKSGGAVVADPLRDAEYTRELGGALAEAYRRDNVVMPTWLVAFALFQGLKRRHPDADLYHLLRLPEPSMPMDALCREVDALRERLRALAERGGIHLGDQVSRLDARALVDAALRSFASYHARRAAELVVDDGERVQAGDLRLLLYYQNRLTGYGLEEVRAAAPVREEVAA